MNHDEGLQTTYQQKLLWQIVENKPELPFMNINVHLQFEGLLDYSSMLNAIVQLVNEEAALRTSFHESDGVLRRRIHAQPAIEFDYADKRSESPERQYDILHSYLESIYSNPMPMKSPLAIRGCLLRLGEEDFRLIATLNHMVADGHAAVLLLLRLAEIYGGDRSMSPQPQNFESYLEDQNRFLSGSHERRQMEFWRQYLDGFDPSDSYSLPSAPEKLVLYRSQLPPDTMRKLAGAGEGTLGHAQIVLKAAYLALLAKAFELKDIGMFSILANRSRDYRTTIGYLANIVIYRTSISDELALQDLIALAKSTLHQVSRNAKLPYSKIWREIFDEDANRIPRFYFNLIPVPDKSQNFGLAAAQPVPGLNDWIYWNGLEHHTLGLTVYTAMPHFAGIEWRYDGRIFNAKDVQRWSDFYLKIVDDLLDSKNVKLCEIDFA
ncbi:condensation domain-containing protein [Cohnella silvisoli]|uniref:Condensation domain-containing protein n=1 Tax=Cohnella silvisoli TaxID=2873699 RepID=A0ABV1KR33_9BACL|nr:condensation domain-containing protein [Cohnella silvisoli]MCD9021766.1 hypothetical protein [Cohnella silvisoli]